MSGTLRLGKFYGIDVNLHISWFIIFLLLTLSLAINWFPQLFAGWSTGTYWITAVIAVLLLFVGVLLHEIAHALVARAHGLTVKGITLFIFGGVAEIDQNAQRPGTEFQIAIAGPIVSGLIAGVAFLLEFPLRGSGTPMVALLNYLAITNLFLGVFNLIPGFPLTCSQGSQGTGHRGSQLARHFRPSSDAALYRGSCQHFAAQAGQ